MAKKEISRRDFIKGAAIGAVGVASAGLLGACAASSAPDADAQKTPESTPQPPEATPAVNEEEIKWDYEADVVVIGSGGAGLPAALKAMEDGASVIIVEANWDVGGHAAVSGGNLHSGCGTEIQKRYGIEDTADQYYLDHTTGLCLASRYDDRNYVRSVADHMREAYEFIQEKGVLVADREPTKQYAYTEGGTEPETVPRWTYTDATTEGWASYTGKGNNGIGITRPLERTIRANGGQFLMNYHMDKIIREGNMSGRALGIQAGYTPTVLPGESARLESFWNENNIETTQPTVNVRAKKGIVVATGGSVGNLYFRTMFDPRLGPELDGLSGEPFSKQDASGELAGMAVGASLGTLAAYMQHGGHQITMPSLFGCQYGYGSGYTSKSPIWKLARASGISPDYESLVIVNMLGQRCGNEDKASGGKYSYDSYDFFNTALASVVVDPDGDGNAQRYGGPLWAIFDQDCVDRQGYAMEQGVVDFESGYCFKADTLEELAAAVVNKYYEHVKMDPQILADTITRYNGYIDAGSDPEFNKTTLVNKIQKGPFYAAWATPCLHDTYAGLRCNDKMQVMDIFGEVIPGLYAGGECSAGMRIHGFGRVITSGYIAGKFAAAEKV